MIGSLNFKWMPQNEFLHFNLPDNVPMICERERRKCNLKLGTKVSNYKEGK